MSKYEFNWDDFTAQYWEDFCYEASDPASDTIDKCFGGVHVGNLCFDLTVRDYGYDAPALMLDYDLYVGGVDTGYGYSIRLPETPEYPYDYYDESDTFGRIEPLCNLSYEDFKAMAEDTFTKFIDTRKKYRPVGHDTDVSLIDKALEPLLMW